MLNSASFKKIFLTLSECTFVIALIFWTPLKWVEREFIVNIQQLALKILRDRIILLITEIEYFTSSYQVMVVLMFIRAAYWLFNSLIFFRQTLPNYPFPSILVYLLFLLNIWEIILVKDYLNVLYVHQNIHNQIKFSTVLFLISVFRDIVIADFFLWLSHQMASLQY